QLSAGEVEAQPHLGQPRVHRHRPDSLARRDPGSPRPPGDQRRRRHPAAGDAEVTEGRRRVLDRVAAGRRTPDEADRRLTALGAPEQPATALELAPPRPTSPRY